MIDSLTAQVNNDIAIFISHNASLYEEQKDEIFQHIFSLSHQFNINAIHAIIFYQIISYPICKQALNSKNARSIQSINDIDVLKVNTYFQLIVVKRIELIAFPQKYEEFLQLNGKFLGISYNDWLDCMDPEYKKFLDEIYSSTPYLYSRAFMESSERLSVRENKLNANTDGDDLNKKVDKIMKESEKNQNGRRKIYF